MQWQPWCSTLLEEVDNFFSALPRMLVAQVSAQAKTSHPYTSSAVQNRHSTTSYAKVAKLQNTPLLWLILLLLWAAKLTASVVPLTKQEDTDPDYGKITG